MRAVTALLFTWLVAASATAQDGDGLYGRFDGDVTLAVGAGGGASLGDRETGLFTAELRARYLDAAGPFVAIEWGCAADPCSAGANGRVTLGVELKPLFPALFLVNAFSGKAFVDLLLTSIWIEIGAALTPLDGSLGAALSVGSGLEIPLLFPDGEPVLGLRLGARYAFSPQGAPSGPEGGVNDFTLLGVLSLRAQIDTGLAAWEGARYRTR